MSETRDKLLQARGGGLTETSMTSRGPTNGRKHGFGTTDGHPLTPWRIAVAVLIAFCASVPVAGYARASKIAETLRVAGLNQPVEILRDMWGINHIYAKDEHDLFFAQGYSVARDR